MKQIMYFPMARKTKKHTTAGAYNTDVPHKHHGQKKKNDGYNIQYYIKNLASLIYY